MKPSRDAVSEKIIEIVREQAKKGDKKLPPERKLAKQLGISRNMLRESLVLLEVKGILEKREKQGTFIKKTPLEVLDINLSNLTILPEDYIRHIREVRFMIEVPAAMMAAINRTETDIMRISQSLTRLEELYYPNNEIEASLWDANFHFSVVKASQNSLLAKMYENIFTLMKDYIDLRRKKLFSVNVNHEQSLAEHKSILASIKNGDGELAARNMRYHLSKSHGKF